MARAPKKLPKKSRRAQGRRAKKSKARKSRASTRKVSKRKPVFTAAQKAFAERARITKPREPSRGKIYERKTGRWRDLASKKYTTRPKRFRKDWIGRAIDVRGQILPLTATIPKPPPPKKPPPIIAPPPRKPPPPPEVEEEEEEAVEEEPEVTVKTLKTKKPVEWKTVEAPQIAGDKFLNYSHQNTGDLRNLDVAFEGAFLGPLARTKTLETPIYRFGVQFLAVTRSIPKGVVENIQALFFREGVSAEILLIRERGGLDSVQIRFGGPDESEFFEDVQATLSERAALLEEARAMLEYEIDDVDWAVIFETDEPHRVTK